MGKGQENNGGDAPESDEVEEEKRSPVNAASRQNLYNKTILSRN
jgi:hypothetical protein